MQKRFNIVILCVLAATSMFAQDRKWYDPEEAGYPAVHGQAFQDEHREGFYDRLPDRVKEGLSHAVWSLSRQTAGESICFTTDSKDITVRYKVRLRTAMPHMPATGVSGVDLYTKDKHGNEVWLAPKYSFKDTVTFSYSAIEPVNMRGNTRRYTLFLPLYNEVEWLEIGVGEEDKFCFERPSAVKPVVTYGTSICQGACASRPAMSWTNILQRRLDRPFVNLGFSGSAYFESSIIDILSEVDAAVYVIDGMPNAYAIPAPALRDTVVKAVRRLRAARPDTPVVLTDHCGYPHGSVYKYYRDAQEHALKSLEEAYQQLIAEGVTGLYRLRYEDIGMSGEMTVEAIHMSDYGMTTYADAYEPLLRDILCEPSGDVSATRPVTQQRDSYNWLERHDEILSKGNGKHFRRIVIGDSIMHFWGGSDVAPAQNGTDSWAELGGESLNLGCGYDRTENVLWRIYHGELDNLTADKVFIMIGTNNISWGDPDEEIVAGIKAVINAVRTRLPQSEITVMGILPRRNREARVKTLNKAVKAMAREENVNFADPGKTLLGKGGKIDESLFTDGLHPDADGYRRIADYFR